MDDMYLFTVNNIISCMCLLIICVLLCLCYYLVFGASGAVNGCGCFHGDAISLAALTQPGGGYLRSGWLLFESQWVEVTASPMNVLRHTVVCSRGDGRLYIYMACAPPVGSICDRVTALCCSRTSPSHIGQP